MELSILKVDLQNSLHCDQVIKLLNDYMNDSLENNRPHACRFRYADHC